MMVSATTMGWLFEMNKIEFGDCRDTMRRWAKEGDIVLDPFMGSGTTAQVAQELGRQYLGCELNPDYKKLQDKRTAQLGLILE